MSQTPKKRKIVIHIDDYCVEPFEDTDLKHFKDEMEDMLADYDIQVTAVTIEEEGQSDWQSQQRST